MSERLDKMKELLADLERSKWGVKGDANELAEVHRRLEQDIRKLQQKEKSK
jgi:hypothetical protein